MKSTGLAYLLWLFLGFLGVHRFYLEKPISAFLFILSWAIFLAPLWWMLDLFLIPGMVAQANARSISPGQAMNNNQVQNVNIVLPAPPATGLTPGSQMTRGEGETIECPACAETIKAKANRCRFCGEDLGADPVA